jgi:methanesulfonate monooxygenase large subunit
MPRSERLTGQSAPPLPLTHYLDNRIYTDEEIFAEERERIFARAWKFVCHDSELPEIGSFRAATVAGRPLFVVRSKDGKLRTFFNSCAHRGAQLVREPAGKIAGDTLRCFYHLWSYDSLGRCTGIPEPAGYAASGITPDRIGLREVRTGVVFGLVFVRLDDDAETLEDFLGPEAIEAMRVPFGTADLEVFHLHRAELRANWKMFVETNAEGYHELLHLFNRTTAVSVREYRKRHWRLYANGHVCFEQAVIDYERLKLEARDTATLPGMVPNGHVVVDLFPDVMLNCRSTVVRIDSLVPVAPGLTVLECRGLGLKGDAPEIRAQRVRQHNQVWGPMGRNLPEDIWAVETQWRSVASGASRYSVIARDEELGPMDDGTLRHWYAAWRARVERGTHDIGSPWPASRSAS